MARHVYRGFAGVSSLSSFRGLLRPSTARYTTEGGNEEGEGRPPSDLYYGIASNSFSPEIVNKLMAPVNIDDIEIKADGLIYLPEIMYRRTLNGTFGPGGWGLMPLGETRLYNDADSKISLVSREYALYCQGKFVAQSLGEHTFYGDNNMHYGKACESAKSNALMRCCKDLGIASELWDPKFVIHWKEQYAVDIWCQNERTREKKKLWRKANSKDAFPYPWKEMKRSQ